MCVLIWSHFFVENPQFWENRYSGVILVVDSILSYAEVPKKLPPPKERGENLYKELCWQCHGSLGKADGPLSKTISAPALAGATKEKILYRHHSKWKRAYASIF